MAIRLSDALDARSNGGYVDRETGEYIRPRWFARQCPENDNGYGDEDYLRFRENPGRFEPMPILNGCAPEAEHALSHGIAREELEAFGMGAEVGWEPFFPPSEEPRGFSEAERAISRYIRDRLYRLGLLRTFESVQGSKYTAAVIEWFEARGYRIEDDIGFCRRQIDGDDLELLREIVFPEEV